MNKKKIINILKIFFIVVISVILLAAIGLMIIFNTVIKPHSKQITHIVEQIANDEEMIEKIKPYMAPEEFAKLEKTFAKDRTDTATDQTGTANDETDSISNNNKTDTGSGFETSENNIAAPDTASKNPWKTDRFISERLYGPPTKNTSTDSKTESVPEEKETAPSKKSRSDYKSNYDYIKDNVPASDFAIGSSILAKIDVGYISSMMSGDMTPERKAQLKEYVTSHLSGEEISQALSLYSKYSYLLN